MVCTTQNSLLPNGWYLDFVALFLRNQAWWRRNCNFSFSISSLVSATPIMRTHPAPDRCGRDLLTSSAFLGAKASLG
jgi:hypothetical protein